MKNKKTIQKIIIGFVVALILLIAYAAINGETVEYGKSSLSSLRNAGPLGQVSETDTNLANAEILRILGSIENISLDDDIFSNPVFRILVDSRFTIPNPLIIGRPNPFLPIGFDNISELDQQIEDQAAANFGNIIGESQSGGTSGEGSDFFETF